MQNIILVSAFTNLIDKFLNGSSFPVFQIQYMDFTKTADKRDTAVQFTGLIKSDGYSNSIEISQYPTIDGLLGTDGIYKTEGASCVLELGLQIPNDLQEDDYLSWKSDRDKVLNNIKLDPRNLYIRQQANMPDEMINYRIVDVEPIELLNIGVIKYRLPMQQVRMTSWNNKYMSSNVTKPEYKPSDNSGSAPSKNVPLPVKK